jgi:glutathione synthase/RimK-type ligase-like ATP-grasp enzyme
MERPLYVVDWTRKIHSESARALAKELGVLLARRTTLKQKHNSIILNWGCSSMPDWSRDPYIINRPEAVHRSANKRRYFRRLANTDYIPGFTEDWKQARLWAKKQAVVCRTKLTGHSGAGIVIANTPDEVVDAPLYVVYVPKKQEYRVHVFDGEIIGMRRKARRLSVPDDKVNWQIRAEKNGFVYVNEFDKPWRDKVETEAGPMCIDIIRRLELHFGAIDIVWNEKDDKFYALEVNTAPGIEGGSVKNYADAVKKFVTKL